jgi:hypothetical protein
MDRSWCSCVNLLGHRCSPVNLFAGPKGLTFTDLIRIEVLTETGLPLNILHG